MSSFLVNESCLLDRKTIETLQLGSEPFEHVHSRSIIIIGMYAITAHSIFPVSVSLTVKRAELTQSSNLN